MRDERVCCLYLEGSRAIDLSYTTDVGFCSSTFLPDSPSCAAAEPVFAWKEPQAPQTHCVWMSRKICLPERYVYVETALVN